MQNFMKTILSGIQTWTKGKIKKSITASTADWNQNDPSADNYVKNRTHWEEKRLTCLIPEKTVTISGDGGYETLEDPFPVLIVGQTYTVVLNGVTYECIARRYNDSDALLGNGTIYGDGDAGNGEPFSIDSYDNSSIYLNVATAGKYTISISKGDIVIHKLDSKYLDIPTNLATTDDVQEVLDVASEAQNTASEAQNTASEAQNTASEAQQTANNKMDKNNPVGTGSFSMNRKSGTDVGNYSSTLGRYNTAAGVFSHVSGYYNTAIGYQSVCGKFNKNESFYRIEQRTRLAPEGYYLRINKNKSIYISNEFSFDDSTGQFSLVNPICINTDEFVNNRNYYEYYAICTWNPSNVGYATIYIEYDVTSGPNILLHSAATAGFVSDSSYYKSSFSGNGKPLPIYYAYSKLNSAGAYAHIVGNGTSDTARSNAHTLDWNGVGWYQGGLQVGGNAQDDGAKNVLLEGDAIPIPENATVGQTIAVKSVDENGKPVEWEATDFSSSGGSGCIVSDIAPEDTSVLWIDTADNSDDTLQDAVNIALAQAKESGEFKGDPGKTPEKGVDYYTDTDKAELVNAVLSALPAWTGGSY